MCTFGGDSKIKTYTSKHTKEKILKKKKMLGKNKWMTNSTKIAVKAVTMNPFLLVH